MSLVDVFSKEDRVPVTFTDFFNLVQQAAKYENVMNAVKCDVPHIYIREMATGKKEEDTYISQIEITPPPEEFRKRLKEYFGKVKDVKYPDQQENKPEQEQEEEPPFTGEEKPFTGEKGE